MKHAGGRRAGHQEEHRGPRSRGPSGRLQGGDALSLYARFGGNVQILQGRSLSDLDLPGGTLLVRQGKGRKDRVVPTGERVALFVSAHLTRARPDLVVPPDDGVLLLTATGHPFSPDVLTGLCRRYVERADIGKTGACHLFRHTMATLILEGGADVRFIQQMLGHARLDTTALHTNVSLQKLKDIRRATHPGARLDAAKGGQEPGLLDGGNADDRG